MVNTYTGRYPAPAVAQVVAGVPARGVAISPVNGTLDGSLLVANLYDSSGIYTPAHLLPPSGAPGVPTINWNGGGNASINYDSCWSTAMSTSLNYRIVAVREMVY